MKIFLIGEGFGAGVGGSFRRRGGGLGAYRLDRCAAMECSVADVSPTWRVRELRAYGPVTPNGLACGARREFVGSPAAP
jgi:hypothetical protein